MNVSAARFLSLTAICFLVVDLGLRRYATTRFFWDDVNQSDRSVNVLFIGTSRTAAAIDVDAFRASLRGSDLNVINAGAGYVTPAEFFFALRNTLHDRPERLRDTALLIEAPDGMPDPQAWSDGWPHPDRPAILTPLLRAEDIPHYWRTGHAFEDKLALSASYVLRPSSVVTYRQDIAARLFDRLHRLLQSPLESILLAPEPPAAQVDLTTSGGIRSDTEGVVLARRAAEDYARASTEDQHPTDWPATVMSDLVRLAQLHDLRVFFFTPPLHSMHRAIYETPQRRLDRQNFAAFAAQKKTPILTPDFPTSDEDFPDIWHLKKSLAPRYTSALSQSFADHNQSH